MDNRIDQIIDELIKLDSSFASHREQLSKILAAVLETKPEVKIDPLFIKRLKQQILAESQTNKKAIEKIQSNFMKKLLFITAGVAAVVVIGIVGIEKYGLVGNKSLNLAVGTDVRITRASDQAFGDLTNLAAVQATGQASNSTKLDTATPMAADSIAYGRGGGSAPSSLIYQPVSYKFVYKGDDLNLTSDKLDVLKKVLPQLPSSDLSSFSMGLINLGSFGSSNVQSINLTQPDGYNTYIDLSSGMISISNNEPGIYKPLAADLVACPSTGCITPPSINPSDVPDDQALISVAQDFVSAHGISTQAYANPEVIHDQYGVKETFAPVPQVLTVVYPLKINDGKVYDESGSPTGLMIGISLADKKVQSVWNLSTNDYQASGYDAINDPSTILSIAEKGGMYGYTGDPNGKVEEIDLGTPTQQYVTMWDYSNNLSEQILVPSMVFPVLNKPDDGSYMANAIVVPLIKNILNQNGGPIKILNESAPAASSIPVK